MVCGRKEEGPKLVLTLVKSKLPIKLPEERLTEQKESQDGCQVHVGRRMNSRAPKHYIAWEEDQPESEGGELAERELQEACPGGGD